VPPVFRVCVSGLLFGADRLVLRDRRCGAFRRFLEVCGNRSTVPKAEIDKNMCTQLGGIKSTLLSYLVEKHLLI
jgi:hypothetical protein